MSDLLLDDVDDLVSRKEVVPREAPAPKGPSIGDRIGAALNKPKAAPAKKAPPAKATAPAKKTTTIAPPRTTSTPGPKPKVQRRPLGDAIAKVVLQVGRLVNAAVDAPTGAAIMFEAGAFGAAIDTAIAGTRVDKLAQKGAGVAERFEPLVSLISLPSMIFLLSRNPAMEGMIEGELREALEDVLVQSLPLLRKRAERTKATTAAVEELKVVGSSLPGLEGIDLRSSSDPIADILRTFFAVPAYIEPEEAGGES